MAPGLLHNQQLLWNGPRRGCVLFYSLARSARRVARHRSQSVIPLMCRRPTNVLALVALILALLTLTAPVWAPPQIPIDGISIANSPLDRYEVRCQPGRRQFTLQFSKNKTDVTLNVTFGNVDAGSNHLGSPILTGAADQAASSIGRVGSKSAGSGTS